MIVLITGILIAVLCGACVFCVLQLFAAHSYLKQPKGGTDSNQAVAVLKPLAGAEDELEPNLASFFEQDHPDFQLFFAVQDADDPAIAVVDRLRARYPHVRARLLVTGASPWPNAKVFSLARMMAETRSEIIVLSDSDVRVCRDMLRAVTAEFAAAHVGLVTCPYRAVAGPSFWSRLEAAGMNTEFLGGVLVARLLEGMKFALGATIAVRRAALNDIGGFERLRNYLADDFEIGKLVAAHVWDVVLSRHVVEHRIGADSLAVSMEHRLRWARSTRRSRPHGYIGQVFTNPVPVALALALLKPFLWPFWGAAILLRAIAAWGVSGGVLNGPLSAAALVRVTAQDLVSFCIWIAGFAGTKVSWRGREFVVLADGRFQCVEAAVEREMTPVLRY